MAGAPPYGKAGRREGKLKTDDTDNASVSGNSRYVNGPGSNELFRIIKKIATNQTNSAEIIG
jgi:hypothetical protein